MRESILQPVALLIGARFRMKFFECVASPARMMTCYEGESYFEIHSFILFCFA